MRKLATALCLASGLAGILYQSTHAEQETPEINSDQVWLRDDRGTRRTVLIIRGNMSSEEFARRLDEPATARTIIDMFTAASERPSEKHCFRLDVNNGSTEKHAVRCDGYLFTTYEEYRLNIAVQETKPAASDGRRPASRPDP